MSSLVLFFFFNDTATTEIYTLSLHDALPILRAAMGATFRHPVVPFDDAAFIAWARQHDVTLWATAADGEPLPRAVDRKSTRLNSSHLVISYAVFCLKKKKNL